MSHTVLVTGARGKTGSEVVRELRRTPGTSVRAGSSIDPSMEDHVRLDWHDRSTWSAAVDGVDAVYLVRPDLPEAPELVAGLIALHPTAHYVLLSEQGAAQLAPEHWARQVEDAVMSGARRWTLLRPSWFQQVLTDPRFYADEIRVERVLRLPSGGGAIAWVDVRDIAAVAVAALHAPEEHHGRALTVSGPEAITVSAVAAELSDHLGQEVRAPDVAVEGTLHGLDPWTRAILADLYRRVRDGGFAAVSPVVEDITGREPRTVAEFVVEHLEHWR